MLREQRLFLHIKLLIYKRKNIQKSLPTTKSQKIYRQKLAQSKQTAYLCIAFETKHMAH